mmetsp:Transcript_514/g.613  ORF Transcript_514/g.613 Transcript_514/m.613 type:complete len:186 (-) Transcript_514:113-670(-)
MDLYGRLKRLHKRVWASPRSRKGESFNVGGKSRSEISYLTPNGTQRALAAETETQVSETRSLEEYDINGSPKSWSRKSAFLAEVERYKRISTLEDRKACSIFIYNNFLNDDTAAHPLYISVRMHHRIITKLDNPDFNLFDEACAEITTIRDRRYLCTRRDSSVNVKKKSKFFRSKSKKDMKFEYM